MVALVIADPVSSTADQPSGGPFHLCWSWSWSSARSESPVRPVTDLIEGVAERNSASALLGAGPRTNEPGSPQHQPRRTSSLPCLLRSLGGQRKPSLARTGPGETVIEQVGITRSIPSPAREIPWPSAWSCSGTRSTAESGGWSHLDKIEHRSNVRRRPVQFVGDHTPRMSRALCLSASAGIRLVRLCTQGPTGGQPTGGMVKVLGSPYQPTTFPDHIDSIPS